jgi:uncharacterized membrane protein
MSLAPIFNASIWVQLHIVAALGALVLGTVQFLGRKGTLPHRTIGWVWVLLLGGLCVTSFFIPGTLFIGPISVFHALSVYTLWALFMGAKAARDGDVDGHKSYMSWIFGLSVVLSAVIAIWSGGVLYEVFFPRRW